VLDQWANLVVNTILIANFLAGYTVATKKETVGTIALKHCHFDERDKVNLESGAVM
jgi:hypothetical protein